MRISDLIKGAALFLVGVWLAWNGVELYLTANNVFRTIQGGQAQTQLVENIVGLPGLSSLLGLDSSAQRAKGQLETFRWIGIGAAALGSLIAVGGIGVVFYDKIAAEQP